MSSETEKSGVKRRDFLKVLGATGAGATMIGCSSERVEKLIPYFVSPDQTVPGVSTYYASTCRECAASCGIIAETRDGRTIKLEGNPDHPVNRGALCAKGQAALQGLYNPDRYRSPMIRRGGKKVEGMNGVRHLGLFPWHPAKYSIKHCVNKKDSQSCYPNLR